MHLASVDAISRVQFARKRLCVRTLLHHAYHALPQQDRHHRYATRLTRCLRAACVLCWSAHVFQAATNRLFDTKSAKRRMAVSLRLASQVTFAQI